jgi:hypothetical protein
MKHGVKHAVKHLAAARETDETAVKHRETRERPSNPLFQGAEHLAGAPLISLTKIGRAPVNSL